jgi:hypothetical protein
LLLFRACVDVDEKRRKKGERKKEKRKEKR